MELAKLKRKYLKLLKDYNKLAVKHNTLVDVLHSLKIAELQLVSLKEVK